MNGSPSSVLTLGLGSWGSTGLVLTLGLGVGAAPNITTGPYRYVATATHQPGSQATAVHQPGSIATGAV